MIITGIFASCGSDDETTSGENVPPELVSSDPPSGAVDIAVTQRTISFTFNEPMKPGRSISWSGNLPAQDFVDHYWSDDRMTIYCVYGTDLPSGETISWVLNPTGYGLNFKDVNGNPLPADKYTGSFTTQ